MPCPVLSKRICKHASLTIGDGVFVGSVHRSYLEDHRRYSTVLGRRQPRKFVFEEELMCELKTLCVIIIVILKELQLFVVTTCEDPINRVIKSGTHYLLSHYQDTSDNSIKAP
jgi:hypothetical protein